MAQEVCRELEKSGSNNNSGTFRWLGASGWFPRQNRLLLLGFRSSAVRQLNTEAQSTRYDCHIASTRFRHHFVNTPTILRKLADDFLSKIIPGPVPRHGFPLARYELSVCSSYPFNTRGVRNSFAELVRHPLKTHDPAETEKLFRGDPRVTITLVKVFTRGNRLGRQLAVCHGIDLCHRHHLLPLAESLSEIGLFQPLCIAWSRVLATGQCDAHSPAPPENRACRKKKFVLLKTPRHRLYVGTGLRALTESCQRLRAVALVKGLLTTKFFLLER